MSKPKQLLIDLLLIEGTGADFKPRLNHIVT
jgi:hypothetical protein